MTKSIYAAVYHIGKHDGVDCHKLLSIALTLFDL
jgi:hypothetical protein